MDDSGKAILALDLGLVIARKDLSRTSWWIMDGVGDMMGGSEVS